MLPQIIIYSVIFKGLPGINLPFPKDVKALLLLLSITGAARQTGLIFNACQTKWPLYGRIPCCFLDCRLVAQCKMENKFPILLPDALNNSSSFCKNPEGLIGVLSLSQLLSHNNFLHLIPQCMFLTSPFHKKLSVT